MSTFGKIKTGADLAEAVLEVAKKYKTLYVTGCFGAPLNDKNKQRWMNEYEANRKDPRKTNIQKASADTFGFDCVNLIKALLWGWNGDVNASYGGAKYQSNGIPDIDEGSMFALCKDQSNDFSKIEVGEAVWMQGHIGIYIGDGLAVECTPAWTNNVQITACNCTKAGYNRRNWTSHGKLPYVTYQKPNTSTSNTTNTSTQNTTKRTLSKGMEGEDVKQLQKDLITLGYDLGKWGADGDFGEDTDKAVRAFQKDKKLTVDGIVGNNTFNALEKALKEQKKSNSKPTTTTTTTSTGYYRIRKSWKDAASQKGAYTSRDNAIKHCKTLGSEYKVYDENGVQVYPATSNTKPTSTTFVPYVVKITAKNLNVRKGPGTNYAVATTIPQGGAYTIVEEKDGWGKLKSGAGWIDLVHTKKL